MRRTNKPKWFLLLAACLLLASCAPQSSPEASVAPSAMPSATVATPALTPAPTEEVTLLPESSRFIDGARDFDADGFVFPISSERELTFADFHELMGRPGGLPYFELLRYARNEIFARHGHAFNDEDLAAHYAQHAWYSPITQETPLTPLEEKNIGYIKDMERAIDGETVSIAMAAGEPVQNEVYAIDALRYTYAFYDVKSDTFTSCAPELMFLSDAGVAGFTHHAQNATTLYGHGGKQLTRGADIWYEYDKSGNLVSIQKRGKAYAITLHHPDTLGALASFPAPASIDGYVDWPFVYYAYVALPDGSYIVNEPGAARIIERNGSTRANLPYEHLAPTFAQTDSESLYINRYDQPEDAVRIPVEKGDLWGAIDAHAKLVLPCIYTEPPQYQYGLAITRKQDGTCVCIDLTGHEIALADASWATVYPGGLIGFSAQKGSSFFVDKTGKKFAEVDSGFDVQFAQDGSFLLSSYGADTKRYAFDASLAPLPLPPGVEITTILSRDRFFASIPGETGEGIINGEGTWLLEPAYFFCYFGQSSVIMEIMRYGHWCYGLYDYNGTQLLPPIYAHMEPRGKLYAARTNTMLGLIDENGTWLARSPLGLYILDDEW